MLSKWPSQVSEPEPGCKKQEAIFSWRVLDGSWAEKPGNPFALERQSNWCCVVKMKNSEASEHVTQREMSLVTLRSLETAYNSNKVGDEYVSSLLVLFSFKKVKIF